MPQPSPANRKPPLTHRLLLRAHSPNTASNIHASKFVHKPLRLVNTEPNFTSSTSTRTVAHNTTASATSNAALPTSSTTDSRALRRAHRLSKANSERERRRQKGKGRGPNSLAKPKPLSAAEKRKFGVHDIPKNERVQWDVYVGLHRLWCGYIRNVLGVGDSTVGAGGISVRRDMHVVPQNAGALLASADFHGARVQVVRCRSVGRVGIEGIVVRDTKFTFVIVTKDGMVKTLPKEHTIFRFEIPLMDSTEQEKPTSALPGTDATPLASLTASKEQHPKDLVFELNGEQFKNRTAPERARKQFKMHLPAD